MRATTSARPADDLQKGSRAPKRLASETSLGDAS
jgi:hypothetical protein